jgi:hypothetical protein
VQALASGKQIKARKRQRAELSAAAPHPREWERILLCFFLSQNPTSGATAAALQGGLSVSSMCRSSLDTVPEVHYVQT